MARRILSAMRENIAIHSAQSWPRAAMSDDDPDKERRIQAFLKLVKRRQQRNRFFSWLAVPLGSLTTLLIVFTIYKLFGLTGLLVGVLVILIFYRFFCSFSGENGASSSGSD